MDTKPKKKISATSIHRAAIHLHKSHFQTLRGVTCRSFRLCQALVFISWGVGVGWWVSYVFPRQWGHAVCLTTGLRTAAWWLSGEITGWQCWARKEEKGGWKRWGLKSGFMHIQYSVSTACWLSMLNVNNTAQTSQISLLRCFQDR